MIITHTSYVKDGIETVDASYEAFLDHGLEDFSSYAFELRTIAAKNLAPARIKAYLEIIHEEKGGAASHAVMEYILLVLGKYLQMMVAYSVFVEDQVSVQHRVEKLFSAFNKTYSELNQIFEEVTGQRFLPGQFVEAEKEKAISPPSAADVSDTDHGASGWANTFIDIMKCADNRLIEVQYSNNFRIVENVCIVQIVCIVL